MKNNTSTVSEKTHESKKEVMKEIIAESVSHTPEPITIDMDKVNSLTEKLEKAKAANAAKEYVVKMTPGLLEFYSNFMKHQVPWKGMEALGIAKIVSQIEKYKSSGLKNSVMYMNNLHIEATHYFLNKYEGKGDSLVDSYLELMENMNAALQLVGADNQKTREIEKELAAAQQGLDME